MMKQINIKDIIYPNNQHLIYTYNKLNLPVTVSDGTKINRVTYDEVAHPVQETMPNGVVVDYEFDECGRLTLLENKLNQNIIAKSAYTYDKNSNRLSYTDKNGKTTTYAYDALNQLKEVKGSKLSEYIYDPVGNRDNVSETVNEEKLEAGIYDYDFDYEDRLIKTEKQNETINYTYDGDGTLIKKTVTNGTESMIYEYFYDYTAGLPRLLVEKRSDGTNYNYLYFGGKLYGRTGTGGTVYYHHDGLGSVVAITDENGNILNEYTYEAFGEPIIIKETVENSIMFTGEPYDQSGFVYLRARYYDPTAGRFVSSDKYKGEIADPISQNGYSYCGNNPVNYVDPSGYYTVGLRDSLSSSDNISWNAETRTATATINGITRSFALDSDSNVWIENGRVKMDSSYFYQKFGSVSKVVTNYISNNQNYIGYAKNDPVGNAIIDTVVTAGIGLGFSLGKSTATYAAERAPAIAGKITGYTRHGLNQVISRNGGRGVSPKALLDAVRYPVEVVKQAGGKIKYVGQNAVVILNNAGKVITAWAKNIAGVRGNF